MSVGKKFSSGVCMVAHQCVHLRLLQPMCNRYELCTLCLQASSDVFAMPKPGLGTCATKLVVVVVCTLAGHEVLRIRTFFRLAKCCN